MLTTEDLRKASIFTCTQDLCLQAGVPILAKPLRVIDGDTIVFAIIVNNEMVRIQVRLKGIDTPEKRGGALEKEAAWVASRKTLSFLLHSSYDPHNLEKSENQLAQITSLVTIKPVVCCRKTGRTEDSFGRVIAKVFRENDGKSLTDFLILTGVARVYEERGPWEETKLRQIIALKE
jgi:endonuclease YncB( thermonuclease family)